MAGGAAFSYSSSSSRSYGWTYDVFLSFRGRETRHGFTGHLYKALCDRGINTFIDDEELQRGDEITPSLVKAIKESRIAIIVLSKDYASSSFCLDELATIMECVKGNGRLVLPIFYDVDPSDVRHHKGTYGNALARLEERFKDDKEKVQKWRQTLHQVANLSGEHFKLGYEYEYVFIEKIAREISKKINRVPLHVADYPVGLESRVLEVNKLLNDGSDDGVHMVGIYGTGGIGKTTLARAVYNLIADQFEGLCFLENVREDSIKYGLKHLQEILLSKILGEEDIKLASISEGISVIKHRLHRKKVLLFLDDVNTQQQLQKLVGGPDWFGSGSRVVITTRDKHLLACHRVERAYELNGLNGNDARNLFEWNAFKNKEVDPSFTHFINRAVTYTAHLPLALEVIGSNLFGKSIEEWKSAIDQYERIPDNKIYEILKVSFDALEKEQQNVFLDIACCFKGHALAKVEDLLHAHHRGCMKYYIGVLVDKCLIKIGQFGEVTLHDLIEDMGKEIVRQESPKAPGKRSRLWCHEDIVQVLEDNQGTGEIEIIHLDFPFSREEEVEWDGKAFENMINLKTLIIKNGHFSEAPKHLPNSLRILEWWRCPSQCLPSNFNPKKLSILKLPDNCFMSLEVGSLKKFVNLKVLNFDNSKCLTQIPDVSVLPNLEELSFESCEKLITVHDSVGFLDKLKILNAFGCRKLRSFPPLKLPSLEELKLSSCRSLENFPEILGKMENIKQLELEGTRIKELPFSFQNLTWLQVLSLDCFDIFGMPRIFCMMPERVLFTARFTFLPPEQGEGEEMVSSFLECVNHVPYNPSGDVFRISLAWFANVKELDLMGNNFTILPACIEECRFLWKLRVDECEYLREIRGIPPNLEQFSAVNCKSWTSLCTSVLLNQELHEAGNTVYTLPAARIPEWFEHQSRGGSISFWFRNRFPAIALCLAIGLRAHYASVWISPTVLINGYRQLTLDSENLNSYMKMDHIFLLDLPTIKIKENEDRPLSENEWYHAEVFFVTDKASRTESFAKEIGIHVFKQKSTMKDIRFTHPYKRRKLDDGLNSADS